MKKLLIVVLAIALLAGCGKAAKNPAKNKADNVASEQTTNNNVPYEKPAEGEKAPQENVGNKAPEKDNSTSEFISEESIRNMVLMLLEGAQLRNVEREFDDGVWKYEVEATHLTMKYEFEFNAKTGEVIKLESEPIGD